MINAEPDNKKVKLFNRINWFGIFLFSICDILIVSNDLENKKKDPNKVPDKIIGLNILLFYCYRFKYLFPYIIISFLQIISLFLFDAEERNYLFSSY
jgi:hypothetical protein